MGNNIKRIRPEDFLQWYTIGEKLGSGSSSDVMHGTRRVDGKQYALKMIKKLKLSSSELTVIQDEIEIMHKVSHRNVIQLYEIFETPEHIIMVIELLTGGELFQRILDRGTLSEKEASDSIRCIASALEYLHSRGIVHRDIKPENLIYSSSDADGEVKVTDFGLAKYRAGRPSTSMTTACGTPGYVAPEVLSKQPYGKEVDMWSLGVVSYVLLCGFPPFYSDSTAELFKQIKSGEFSYPDPYWTNISDKCKDLISGLLTVNPKLRLNASQVLEHPWISGTDISTEAIDAKFALRIKVMIAKKILRRAVKVVLAYNRFRYDFRSEEEVKEVKRKLELYKKMEEEEDESGEDDNDGDEKDNNDDNNNNTGGGEDDNAESCGDNDKESKSNQSV